MYGKSVKPGSGICRTYRIETELGSGGSGAVFMAWHKRLRKHVVIKAVKDGLTGAVEVHRNEVEALKNIKNLYIPQVLDFLTEGKYNYTIMEYIEGENFDKLLKSGCKFTQKQIITQYTQLASALDAIHKHDICHRDIKPSNIMLSKTGDVYLIDFNSALVSGNNTGVVSRSMGYASPEQYEYFTLCRNAFAGSIKAYSESIETVLSADYCKTEPVIKEANSGYGRKNLPCRNSVYEIDWKLSDIYSLGATMYHLLTGKRPPVKADEVAKISMLDGYPKDILRIIEKSMQADPLKRFKTANELNASLMCLV